MKSEIFISSIFSILLFSCSISEKDFIGKWKGTRFETNITILSPDVIKGAEEIALSTVIEFSADGTGTYIDEYSASEIEWKYDSKKNTLEMTGFTEGGSQIYNVTSISGDIMVLEMKMRDMGDLSIYFNKIR